MIATRPPGSKESPDTPLERRFASGEPLFFDTAFAVLQGVLPPGFSGLVGAQLQRLFRPLEIECQGEGYEVRFEPVRYRLAPGPLTLVGTETRTVAVGEFTSVWLENPSTTREVPFSLRLRGHSDEVWREGPCQHEDLTPDRVQIGGAGVRALAGAWTLKSLQSVP